MYSQDLIDFAQKEIFSLYGVNTPYVKPNAVRIMGRNIDIDLAENATIWGGGTNKNETYVATNAIDRISSSSASDTLIITIEGHTVDGSGNFTFLTQNATLNGQTAVTLATPLARVHKMYNIGAVDLVGSVNIYENTAITTGVPTDLTKVHDTIVINQNYNTSMKGAYTVANNEYLLIDKILYSANREVVSTANMWMEVREKGKAFRSGAGFNSVASTGTNTLQKDYSPYFIVPANADLRLRANQSGVNAFVSGEIYGILLSSVG